ncbi:glycosyltransferase family 2 protein [Aureibaculum sp. 2210JD6-5]|uniref:glycosyltransferase family 2 protein n=1 Tax=Aureibaculum sp. 2210JD6-5 TaxID=3103957 RepID=UPI002AAC6287|nr:glycosyltransferase family 2 protein [Aureibaculum sp. 2210JD6-5]MDY7396365.1 glycosyltransferase family 2 protein [Aureibaculum sp. 2210JD6-5]
MKIAVVILNWNGKQLLEQFLPAMLKYSSEDAEIYVADNNSPDDSVEYIEAHFPSVKIIQNKENGGYAKGYNDALQHVDADIFALVNSDIEVTENWLKPIVSEFESSKDIAAIQPKILDFKDKTKFEYAGAGGGFIDFFGYPYCRGRIFSDLEDDSNQYDDTTNIFWASGACFFIRKEVYHQLNGFDEDFFAHYEEIDLCWKIKNEGYVIKYVGTSTVYHVGGATLDQANQKKTYLNFRNSLFSILKNVPKRYLLLVILLRLKLDAWAGIKFLIELKPKHTLAIIKAHLNFYWSFPKFLKKRKKIAHKKSDYYHCFSVVWQHFILRRKTFEEIKKLQD